MTLIELLAPAKDLECGKSAILCGADAVYIGGPLFSARKSAGNTLEDIAKLIDFAHLYYAKVYVTINTILTDAEIYEAKKLIEKLYELEVDAIIIQDAGLLEIGLPPVPLIASTQMHNHTLKKVKFLEAAGLKRVILARELSIKDIKHISKNTGIELEGFIHGSLCVCYSGQCYLSYAIGGRSGNRGECAQPCRKTYTLLDNNRKVVAEQQHLLSLKDLNLSENIEELIKAGITSFKIEGRLKDENYIRNVVSYYRQAIDQVLEKLELDRASSGESIINFKPDLKKTFNRDYTTYFINGRNDDIASPFTPKAIGEPAGIVKHIAKDHFKVSTDKQFSPGDGICFFDIRSKLKGTTINRVEGKLIYPGDMSGLKKGMEIYRNFDIKFIRQVKNARIERVIAVNLSLTSQKETLKLKAVDEDGIEAEASVLIHQEPAKNQQLVINNLNTNLSKLGGTEFRLAELDINLDQVNFIPISEINKLRRKLVEILRNQRKLHRIRDFITIIPNNYPYPEKELDYSGNVYNNLAKKFYERHGVEKIAPAAEAQTDMTGKKVMTTKLCLRYQYGLCSKHQSAEDSDVPMFLIDEEGKEYRLEFNCDACEMEIYY
jgi:putative protease